LLTVFVQTPVTKAPTVANVIDVPDVDTAEILLKLGSFCPEV